jgi:hypothetical protein
MSLSLAHNNNNNHYDDHVTRFINANHATSRPAAALSTTTITALASSCRQQQ